MNRAWQRMASYWASLPRWFSKAFVLIALLYLAAWTCSVCMSVSGGDRVYIPVLPKDSAGYAALSDSILHNHSFYSAEAKPETFRTPGYPAFLLARFLGGGSFLTITLIQILMMLAAGLLIQRIGSRHLSVKAASIAALAFLLNPVTVGLALVVLSDTLFVFLYILLFWILSERLGQRFWHSTILAGIIATAALYVRPMGVLAFPIFLAPIILARIGWKRSLISAASISLVSFLLVAPWMARNQKAYGVFEFTSLPTFNITAYNIPMYRAHKNGTSIDSEYQKIVAELGTDQSDWRYLSASPQLKAYISSFLKKNFVGYAEYHAITTAPFFFASDLEWSARLYHIAIDKPFDPGGQAVIFALAHGNAAGLLSKLVTPWWKFAERLFLCVLGLFCVYAIIKQRRNPAIWILAGIVLYIALITGPVSDARYRFPADPFIYLIAASGIVLFAERRSRNTPSPLPPSRYHI